MAEENEKLQVNVDFTPFPELYKQLEEMVNEDMTDRSKFMRRLVNQEWARRHQMTLPLDTAGAAPKRKQAAVVA